MGVFAPRSAAWLITILGSVGLFVARHDLKSLVNKRLSLYALALAGYMLLGCLWAVDPLHSLRSSLAFSGLILCGMGMYPLFKNLKPREREYMAWVLMAGMTVALVLIILEWMFGRPWLKCCNVSPAKAYTNASIMLAILFWPAVNMLRQTYHKIILLCLCMTVMILADCDASMLGLLGASFIIGFWNVLKPIFAKLWVWVMGIAFVVVPLAFNIFLTDLQIVKINEKMRFFSYIHRLYVWQAASNKIKDYHFMGAGMDASRIDKVGGEIKQYFFLRSDNRIDHFHSKGIPMHPHNAPLQIWLELGVIGVLLIMAMIIHVGRMPLASEFATVLTVVTLVGLVSVGAWQSWFISTVLFALFFCTQISQRQKLPDITGE
jgi:O-antigen ligase